jgi:ABC-type branched-subunit amino acid transport system ATPase component
MGMVTPRDGSIVFDGAEIAGAKSHAIARAGIQLVPEDRRIFGSLSVEHLRETDCVAGHVGLELRNPCASHVFEIS